MDSKIDLFIQNIVKEKKPTTVEQLVQLVQERFNIPREEALKHVIGLNDRGKLGLRENSASLPRRVSFFSFKTTWYWAILVLTFLTVVSIFSIPENSFPLAYLRYLFGSIFVLFLPGFCLIKALYPQKEINAIERVVLSLGMSLVLIPIIGLILNLTSWGITVITMTYSLVIFSTVSATIAVFREYKMGFKETS